MAKNRLYSRKELESLRRADLQNLYKIHGLVGANGKSGILIDNLLHHFKSSGFLAKHPVISTTASITSHDLTSLPGSPSHGAPRRMRTIEVQGPPLPPAPSASGSAGAGREGRVVKEMPRRPVPIKKPSRTHIPPNAKSVALASTKTNSKIALPAATAASTTTTIPSPAPGSTPVPSATAFILPEDSEKSTASELQSPIPLVDWEERLRAVEEAFGERIRLLEAVYERRLKEVEERWEARWASIQNYVPQQPSPPASTPRARPLQSPQKRRQPEPSPSASTLAEDHSDDEVIGAIDIPRKRARLDPPHADLDKTPSTSTAPPRTPSPSHQGHLPDNSQSPAINNPSCSSSAAAPFFPSYATTPKPADPKSPSTDAPPSASRIRIAGSQLTPGPIPNQHSHNLNLGLGLPSQPASNVNVNQNQNPNPNPSSHHRRRSDTAPRAVSQAHMELSTITEADEFFRAPSPSISSLLGPSLSRDVTPSRLSPSPSIVDNRFSHPSYPSRQSSSSSNPASGPSTIGLPIPRAYHIRASSSPAREYMDVALHGLASNSVSSGHPRSARVAAPEVQGGLDTESVQDVTAAPISAQMLTPGHRTMLGTERYRDTRFGDIPMMQWGSPNVDLGPATPFH